jgi:hypothetical protein
MRLIIGIVVLASACGANDPIYLASPNNMEAGMDDGSGNPVVAKSSLVLPVKTESTYDMMADMKLAAKLGVMVPYVKVGDLDIEVEYTIKNLDNTPGQAKVELNGANEFFVYDPSMINLTPPGAEEAPPTPGLAGDIPIDIPANGSYSDTFREDQLLEAEIDLDEITRGNVNPFAATLNINKADKLFQPQTPPLLLTAMCMTAPLPAACQTCVNNPQDPSCQPMPMGVAVPRAAFAGIIRVDLVFKPDHHMVLDYTVRVRDHRGIIHDMGLSAPKSQVVQFMPAIYAP